MTPEQQKALALSRARRRRAEAETDSSPLTHFAGGFNRALGAVVDAPENFGEALLSPILGPSPERTTLSQYAGLTGGGAFDPGEPQTATERVAARAGQELIPTIVGAAVPAALATRTAAALPSTAGALPRFGRSIVDAWRAAPRAMAAGEATAGVGSGIGAGVAQELAPGSAAAEMAGQLVGGAAPAALAYGPVGLAARLGAGAVRRGVSALDENVARDRARTVVNDMIGGRLPPDAAANAERAEEMVARMPGFDPSLAQVTGSPTLLRTQRAAEATASGEELERLARRRAASERAVDAFGRSVAPGDPSTAPDAATIAQDAINRRTSPLAQRLLDEQASLDRRALTNANRFRPVSQAETGRVLRGRVDALQQQVRDEMSARADELLTPFDNEIVDWEGLQPRLGEIGARRTPFDARSELPDVTADIMATSGEPVTMRELRALRTRISDDIREALQSGPRARRQLARLVEMRKAIDDSVRQQFGENSELVRRWDQFRAEYRERMVERFDRGAARTVGRTNPEGFYRTDDESVAETFYKSPGGLEQYQRTFGNDPEAAEAMAAAILDDLRVRTVTDGRVNAGRLRSWAQQNPELLRQFPEVARTVNDVERIEGHIAARNATLNARRKRIENASLVRKAASVGRGADPNLIIRSAVNNPETMRSLLRTLNEGERAALRQNIWEGVLDESPARAREFLDANRQTMGMLFEPQHLEDVRMILDAREMLGRVPFPEGAAVSPNPMGDVERGIGMPLTTLESRLFAAASGRTSNRYVLINLAGRMLRSYGQRDIESVFREAIYDRSLARDLVGSGTASEGQWLNRMRDRLAARTMGFGARMAAAPLAEDEQP